jgi:cytochrome P450
MGIATRVNGAAPPFVPLEEIDLASWDFWAQDDDFRDGAFATLRREARIAFHQELAQEGLVSGTGHWALTRYDDVWHVSRHPHIFSSSPSITIPDQNPGLAEFFGSMIVLDDP